MLTVNMNKLGTKLNDDLKTAILMRLRAGKSEDMVATSGYRTDHVQQGARDDPALRQLNNEVGRRLWFWA